MYDLPSVTRGERWGVGDWYTVENVSQTRHRAKFGTREAWWKRLQEMIAKRGENAGKQVVKEAIQRADREERLIVEMQRRKEQEEQQKLAAKEAARMKMELEVDKSRKFQLQLREQARRETAEEERGFVSAVSEPRSQIEGRSQVQLG